MGSRRSTAVSDGWCSLDRRGQDTAARHAPSTPVLGSLHTSSTCDAGGWSSRPASGIVPARTRVPLADYTSGHASPRVRGCPARRVGVSSGGSAGEAHPWSRMSETTEAMETVVITGASRGIGLGLVRRYLDEGRRVVAGVPQPGGLAGTGGAWRSPESPGGGTRCSRR